MGGEDRPRLQITGVEPPIAKPPGSAPGGLAFALGKISPRSFSECVDLTPALIEKLQGEFAVLMKNAAKAPRMSRKSFVEWGKALRYWWHERFLPVLEGILDAVKSAPLEKKYRSLRGLSLPLDPGAGVLKDLREAVPTWAQKTVRSFEPLWKLLRKLSSKPLGKELAVFTTEERRIEGIPVVLEYTGEDELFGEEDYLPQIRELLRRYVRAASDRFPLLLRGQLPVHISFGCQSGDWGGYAARYEGTSIAACAGELVSDLGYGVQVLAHEMGHHIFKNFLSTQDHSLWKMAISGQYEQIDLREALKKSRPGQKVPDPQLAETDPILYLQLEGLQNDESASSRARWVRTTEDIQEYLERGNSPWIKVKSKPITGYGATNDEEAFCEAVGLLVGFGPKALLPEVRRILQRIVPGVRVSSAVGRVVSAWLGSSSPGSG